jgi:hypothetical protein
MLRSHTTIVFTANPGTNQRIHHLLCKLCVSHNLCIPLYLINNFFPEWLWSMGFRWRETWGTILTSGKMDFERDEGHKILGKWWLWLLRLEDDSDIVIILLTLSFEVDGNISIGRRELRHPPSSNMSEHEGNYFEGICLEQHTTEYVSRMQLM